MIISLFSFYSVCEHSINESHPHAEEAAVGGGGEGPVVGQGRLAFHAVGAVGLGAVFVQVSFHSERFPVTRKPISLYPNDGSLP